MNLNRITLVSFLFNLIPFSSLESIVNKNKKSFITPCFDEDVNLAQCSSPDNSCEKSGGGDFKLVRLHGVRVSKRFEFDSVNRLRNNLIIMPGLPTF